MLDNFQFRVRPIYALLFTCEKCGDNNYNVSWINSYGDTRSAYYHIDEVAEKLESGEWKIIEETVEDKRWQALVTSLVADAQTDTDMLTAIQEFVKGTGGYVSIATGGYHVYSDTIDADMRVTTDRELLELFKALAIVKRACLDG